MKEGEPYYRRRGKKIVVEKKISVRGKQKTVYIKTLPKPQVVLDLLEKDAIERIALQKTPETKEKVPEKGVQDLLNEPTKEEILKTLEEVGI